jgi:hypothetical protein
MLVRFTRHQFRKGEAVGAQHIAPGLRRFRRDGLAIAADRNRRSHGEGEISGVRARDVAAVQQGLAVGPVHEPKPRRPRRKLVWKRRANTRLW